MEAGEESTIKHHPIEGRTCLGIVGLYLDSGLSARQLCGVEFDLARPFALPP